MNVIYLLLNVLGGSAGNVLDRINFKRNHISLRHALFLGFLGMSICSGLFIAIADVPPPEREAVAIILALLIIAISFCGNICDSLSLKADDLSLREPLLDFYPILAGLFGYVLYPAEREPAYLWAFIAGTLIVYWGMHRITLGRLQKKGLGYLLLGIILYSTLPSLEKQTLEYIHPAFLTLIRTLGILVLTTIFLPIKKWRGFTPRRVGYATMSSFVCTVGAIAGLYAISAYGVVLTMLFGMLAPATRYLAGQFILKEKVRRVEVLSSLMLTIVVAVTAFIK